MEAALIARRIASPMPSMSRWDRTSALIARIARLLPV
jgi:hypothetical protein